jgi:hypothetical protein
MADITATQALAQAKSIYPTYGAHNPPKFGARTIDHTDPEPRNSPGNKMLVG